MAAQGSPTKETLSAAPFPPNVLVKFFTAGFKDMRDAAFPGYALVKQMVPFKTLNAAILDRSNKQLQQNPQSPSFQLVATDVALTASMSLVAYGIGILVSKNDMFMNTLLQLENGSSNVKNAITHAYLGTYAQSDTSFLLLHIYALVNNSANPSALARLDDSIITMIAVIPYLTSNSILASIALLLNICALRQFVNGCTGPVNGEMNYLGNFNQDFFDQTTRTAIQNTLNDLSGVYSNLGTPEFLKIRQAYFGLYRANP